MNKIKSKKVHIAIVVMALLFLTGGYFAHSFMGANNDDANISKASAKTDAIKETDASEQKKAQKDKKYVLEDDDSLKVTVTDVDVSGKTFKQVKKEKLSIFTAYQQTSMVYPAKTEKLKLLYLTDTVIHYTKKQATNHTSSQL